MRTALLALALLSGCAAPRGPALSARADAAREMNDWPEAQRLYRELAERNPRDPDAWYGLGVAALGQGRPGDAVPAFQRGLALEERASGRYNLGFALSALGRVDQALPHLRRAVELKPDYGLGWYGLARAEAELGNLDEAARAVERARALRPDDPEVKALALDLAARRRPAER